MATHHPAGPVVLQIAPPPSGRGRGRRDDPPAPQVIDLTLRDGARHLLTVDEAAEQLGVGRTLLYELVTSGELESVRIGRLRRIPSAAIGEYVDRLRAGEQLGEPDPLESA